MGVFFPAQLASSQSFINSDGVERKTSDLNNNDVILTQAPLQNKRNVLSGYRSYTYKFTLAALRTEQKIDPTTYVENKDYFVIARSGGKGAAGLDIDLIQTPPDSIGVLSSIKRNVFDPISNFGIQINKQRFQDFNENSAGVFDHYIQRVLINSLMGGNERTNMSISTNIEFDIIEPLSMAGFIEALHVTALACNTPNYIQCKYFLKMEFIGYPDNDELSIPETIPNSTRYFIFNFTEIKVEVTEEGTIYRCKGVPHNEKGYGLETQLTTDVEAQGVTVGEILTSLVNNYSLSNRESVKLENSEGDNELYDEYEVVFPKFSSVELDESFRNNNEYQKNSIFESKVNELYISNAVYAFPDLEEAVENENENTFKQLNPRDPVVPFKRGASILDCISSVIRDSQYAIDIINNIEKVADSAGMVDYFMVHLEADVKGYNESQNRYVHKYRFIVTNYKMHHSRIQPRPSETIDTRPIRSQTHREYEYFYTGKNTEIERFVLEFNSLFFQAIPRNMGNRPNAPAAADSLQPKNSNQTKLKLSDKSNTPYFGKLMSMAIADASKASPDNSENAIVPQAESYAQLSRRMHKAILENVDQVTADIMINGDPYYLVTNGLGLQRIKLNQNGTTGLDEAPIYNRDVMVYIKFINPYDIDQNTGLLKFKNPVAPWSGIFRVLEVESRFDDGEFKQYLKLVRLNSQVEDTNQPPVPLTNLFDSTPDPLKQTSPYVPSQSNSQRANSQALLNDIANGLPITGLPGELSSLLPGSTQPSLPINEQFGSISQISSGATGALDSVGSLINQFSANVQQSLGNLSSLVRLSNAGLTSISPSINQIGGTVDQISKISKTIGFNNFNNQNVAATLNSIIQTPVSQLESLEIDKVTALGNNAAGLISEVSSNIDRLSRNLEQSVSSNLGIDTSVFSGLSSNITGKLTKKITNAVENIPNNVNLTSAVEQGLILENIPASSLSNIPPAQPKLRAPAPKLPLVGSQPTLNQSKIIEQLPAQREIRNRLPIPTFDTTAVAGKLSTINQSISKIIGKTSSIEATLNTISSRIPSGVPNTANVNNSVVNLYSQTQRTNPLARLLNNGID